MFGGKKSNEILVYVKEEPIDRMYKRRLEVSSDGLRAWVVMEKESENKAGWRFDATGCIRPCEKGLYVEVIRGATKAIKIDLQNKNFTLSKLTNDEQQQIINMKIFKAHYGQLLKDLLSALKPLLIILAVGTIISIAIGGFNAYSISKIPEQIGPIVTPAPGGVVG